MNYIRDAADELRQYPLRREALRSMLTEMDTLPAVSLRDPARRGGPAELPEAEREAELARRRKLEWAAVSAQESIRRVEAALEGMDPDYRLALERFYMLPQSDGFLDELREELHALSRADVMRIKKEALHVFALRLFGVIEI